MGLAGRRWGWIAAEAEPHAAAAAAAAAASTAARAVARIVQRRRRVIVVGRGEGQCGGGCNAAGAVGGRRLGLGAGRVGASDAARGRRGDAADAAAHRLAARLGEAFDAFEDRSEASEPSDCSIGGMGLGGTADETLTVRLLPTFAVLQLLLDAGASAASPVAGAVGGARRSS